MWVEQFNIHRMLGMPADYMNWDARTVDAMNILREESMEQ